MPRVVLIAALLMAAGLISSAPAYAQAGEAEAVLERLERAINAHDETQVLALFADGGRIVQAGTERSGAAELRDWLSEQRAGNLHIHLGSYTHADGVVRFSVEAGAGEWYTNGAAPRQTTGTAHVRNGQVVSFALDAAALPPTASGPRLPVLPALGALIMLAAVAFGIRRESSAPAARPQPGALMDQLDAWAKVRRRA